MQELVCENRKDHRIKWIDCSKAVAMIAVIVDHCAGLLYHRQLIASASYFSVTLFVLLSGISVCLANTNKQTITFASQAKKVWRYFIQYALATSIAFSLFNNGFDLKSVVTQILNFSMLGPFYYFLFFFQLMLIAPLLLSWCTFCSKQKYAITWHVLTLFVLCFICSVLINYTFMLPVHGGGQYLFGGTYLLIYYIGILLGNSCVFDKLRDIGGWGLTALAFAIWITWLLLFNYNKLPFDRYLASFWGAGFNPPSIQFIVFGLITLFLLYFLFNNFQKMLTGGWHFLEKLLVWTGRNTMYTFLYHIVVRDIILKLMPAITNNIWLLRLCVFIPMVFLPALIVTGLKALRKKYTMFLKNT